MPRFEDSLEEIYINNRRTWRRWLEKNHRTSRGIWLVYYKVTSHKASVRYPEAVREALCFGWIDSKVQSLDEERYRQIFTPRKSGSVWSRLNKQYIEELRAEGLMTAAGLEMIEAARQDGSWTALDAIEELIVPPDFKKALKADAGAAKFYESLTRSVKKAVLFRLSSAKREETRKKRLTDIMIALAQQRNPLM